MTPANAATGFESGTRTIVPAELPTDLFGILARSAELYGDNEFMVIGLRQEAVGFRELRDRADRFGQLLGALGVTPGDRVALWMTNRVDWVVAAYGIARCGAVLVPLNTRLSSREVGHMLELTRPRVLVMEDVFLGKVMAIAQIESIFGMLRERGALLPTLLVRSEAGPRAPDALDWNEALSTIVGEPLSPSASLVARNGEGDFPELEGVAAILSTSGTTASPKGVMLRHDGLIREAAEVALRQALRPGERFYSIGTLYHCAGYMHGVLCNLIAGSTYYTTPAFTAQETWQVMSGERITVYHGFAIPLQEMERLPQFDRTKLSLNRAWFGAVPKEMARLEAAYDAHMCEIYGLTETGGNVSICTPDDPTEMRHDSDGRPLPGVEVKVIDPETRRVLPDGAPGEICVRGFNVMQGYFRDAEVTRRTIDPDGWLLTGDMGVTKCGYIKWLTRLKDVIRVGGENLSPLEVEEVIVAHPAVAQVAVVAAPHARLGEVPVAFIILELGWTITESEIDQHCRAQLANFKVPRKFIILEDFPRTAATMRIQKAKLRDMAAEHAPG